MAKNGVGTAPAQVYTPFYSKLQQWILAQQEFETTYSRAAPLTRVQRKLLTELEQTLIFEPEPDVEPEVGDTNWVGKLLEYRAANQNNYGGDVHFTEEPVPGPSTTFRWRYLVRLEEAATTFPDGVQPSFARKKDAKQYAAKCAVEWLRANNFMPADGVRFPKAQRRVPSQVSSSSPPAAAAATAKRQRLSTSPRSPATASASNGNTAQNGARVSSPPPVLAGKETSPFDADEPSATEEVAEMCKKLGFPPPQYKLTQDPQHQGFWNGCPEFEQWSLGPAAAQLPPPGAVHVENVYGKKLARQQIAELLLPYLDKAWDARQARQREFKRKGPVAESARATASSSG